MVTNEGDEIIPSREVLKSGFANFLFASSLLSPFVRQRRADVSVAKSEDSAGRRRINGVNETKISAGLSGSSVLSSEEFHDSTR